MMTNASKFNGAALPSCGDKLRFESDGSQSGSMKWFSSLKDAPFTTGMKAYICFNGMYAT